MPSVRPISPPTTVRIRPRIERTRGRIAKGNTAPYPAQPTMKMAKPIMEAVTPRAPPIFVMEFPPRIVPGDA
jgi:hypothetical protein